VKLPEMIYHTTKHQVMKSFVNILRNY
jgi:hypothetical protein